LNVLGQDIYDAVKKNDLVLVKKLIERNPELANAQDTEGHTPLFFACRATPVNSELITLLIEKGADVDAKDKQGIGILLSAVWSGNKEATQLLLLNGADINIEDNDGHTPLWWASDIRFFFYSKDMVELLISKGARIPEDEETLRLMLHSAAFHGHQKFVKLLIDKGADIESQNHDGGTFLHSASAGGLLEYVELMIQKGIDLNRRNRYGLTPLHMAAIRGQREVCRLLLENGADIHAASIEGKTAIHYALECPFQEVAELLIAEGADPQPPRFPILRGEYLGQKKPGLIPELFAPGIISTIYYEHTSVAFSPDGKEVFWSPERWHPLRGRILFMELQDNQWTAPQYAMFGDSSVYESNPIFSPNGKRLYFSSNRQVESSGKKAVSGIWFVERTNGGWSEPKSFDTLVRPDQSDSGASSSRNGSLYFASRRRIRREEGDIYGSRFLDGQYGEPETLGDAINSEFYDAWPYIAPDEQYVLFESSRPGGYGGTDIYVSFRKRDGSWINAVNLGEKINGKGEERFVSVSPDGQFLFFASDRNGNMDVYWVDARIVEPLRLAK